MRRLNRKGAFRGFAADSWPTRTTYLKRLRKFLTKNGY